jgi:hypothetical protein
MLKAMSRYFTRVRATLKHRMERNIKKFAHLPCRCVAPKTPSAMLATAPTAVSCAYWHSSSDQLYYTRARSPMLDRRAGPNTTHSSDESSQGGCKARCLEPGAFCSAQSIFCCENLLSDQSTVTFSGRPTSVMSSRRDRIARWRPSQPSTSLLSLQATGTTKPRAPSLAACSCPVGSSRSRTESWSTRAMKEILPNRQRRQSPVFGRTRRQVRQNWTLASRKRGHTPS